MAKKKLQKFRIKMGTVEYFPVVWRDVGEPTDPGGEVPELDDVPGDEGERQEDESGDGGRRVPRVEQVGERERRYAQREQEDEHVA